MVSYTTPPPSNAEHSHGPNPYDAAQTFAESDNFSHNKTVVSSESVQISNEGTAAEKTGTVSWSWSGTASNDAGILFVPDVDCGGVKFTTGPNTSATITLYRQSDGTNLGSVSLGASSTGAIAASLTAGTEYRLSHGATTHDYGSGPDQSATDITVTDGWYNGARDTSNLRSVTDIVGTQAPKNGSATLEWPYPNDVYEWDIATYTRTLDGETVDVYVAYNDGSGWTRTNGGNAIKRNYSLGNDSNISASDDVRIEAEFSRTDTANNPTLDSAYRSWRL